MPVNLYKPSTPCSQKEYHLDTPPDSYDVNFIWPVPDELSTPGGVSLVPFVPSLHGKEVHSLCVAHPDVWSQTPVGPFASLAAFLTFIETGVRADPTRTLFVVSDTSPNGGEPSPVAGLVGLLHSSTQNGATELGPVIVFPPFQRTHVLSHAVAGCVLPWLLNPPSHSGGGLGLRRVVWCANAANAASVRAAERLAFSSEGTHKWDRALARHKTLDDGGIELPPWVDVEAEHAAGRGLGRDTVTLALTWDAWRDRGQSTAERLTQRPIVPKARQS